MRYRSFGVAGKAVSAVGLLLRSPAVAPTPQACRALLFCAMENGVNLFEIAAESEALERGVAEALTAVERRLIFLAWRICGRSGEMLDAERLGQIVRRGLQRTGADYFDLLMLDEAAFAALTVDGRQFLGDLRAGGAALQIGVSGDGEAADACVGAQPFDVLATPFNLTSDWRSRRRVREASAAGMVALAYDSMPPDRLRPVAAPQGAAPSILRRTAHINPLAGAGTYAFLHHTPGWTPEELCLAYALTEPSLATVQVEDARPEALERLAAVAERELPTGLAAQIEMARFSVEQPPEQKRA